MKCGTKKGAIKQSHTLKYVEQCFKDQGCELLEKEYKNNRCLMKYRCNCGNISSIRFSDFQIGIRCIKCGGNEKHALEFVEQYFKYRGCRLLEKKYINNNIRMKYKCNCGNISKISFKNFRKGERCYRCGIKKIALKLKNSFDETEQYFEEQGCQLLEKEYINNNTKMKYICNCGNISEISFNSFQKGERCYSCSIKKRSGKNHFNYNFNLSDEDRKDRRKNPEYKQWIKDIYKKDNYTCQKCLKNRTALNAHHIMGFAENKKLRTDIDNGITFCQSCHHKFHSKYGKKNINRYQLNEFLGILTV